MKTLLSIMGYSYHVLDAYDPQVTPVGASCHAKVHVGVENAGDCKVVFSEYDENHMKQEGTFIVTMD